MKKIWGFLAPHLAIVLSLMIVTFFIIDRFNEAMAFLNNDITKVLTLILAVLCLYFGVREILRRHQK